MVCKLIIIFNKLRQFLLKSVWVWIIELFNELRKWETQTKKKNKHAKNAKLHLAIIYLVIFLHYNLDCLKYTRYKFSFLVLWLFVRDSDMEAKKQLEWAEAY